MLQQQIQQQQQMLQSQQQITVLLETVLSRQTPVFETPVRSQLGVYDGSTDYLGRLHTGRFCRALSPRGKTAASAIVSARLAARRNRK